MDDDERRWLFSDNSAPDPLEWRYSGTSPRLPTDEQLDELTEFVAPLDDRESAPVRGRRPESRES